MTKSQARETRELRIRRGVIERLQFLFQSACSNVQVVNDVVWQRIPNVWSAIGKTTLCEASSHTRKFEQIMSWGPEFSWWTALLNVYVLYVINYIKICKEHHCCHTSTRPQNIIYVYMLRKQLIETCIAQKWLTTVNTATVYQWIGTYQIKT